MQKGSFLCSFVTKLSVALHRDDTVLSFSAPVTGGHAPKPRYFSSPHMWHICQHPLGQSVMWPSPYPKHGEINATSFLMRSSKVTLQRGVVQEWVELFEPSLQTVCHIPALAFKISTSSQITVVSLQFIAHTGSGLHFERSL